MKRISSVVAALLMFAPVVSANPFSDVPKNHWAYESVVNLTQKGILSGFPDGTFRGNKPVNRYSLAMVTAKMLSVVDQKTKDGSINTISKGDLDTLGALTVEFADELALLGVKVTSAEQQMAEIQKDVSSLKSDVANMKKDYNYMIGDNVRISGDLMVRNTYAKEENDWNQTPNTYTQMKLRLVFDAKIDDNITAKVRWRIFNFNDNIFNPGVGTFFGNQLGGGVQMVNEIDIANLTFKNLLYDGNLEVGRSFRSSGNGLVLHTYVDGLKYSKKAGKVQLGVNMFYDNIDHDNDGVKEDTSRPIWNLSFKTKYKEQDMYLGYYTQNRGDIVAREDVKRDIVELGSKGKLNNEGTFGYDLSLVYNSNTEKGVEDQKGWLKYLALNYNTKKDLAAKVSIAVADEDSQAAIANVTYNRRSTGSSESVFEDVAKGNTWFQRGLRNMKDVKIQAEYKPKKSKHYGRIAYDILSKYKDENYNDNFSTKAGVDVKDGDAGVMTLEYRYQLAKNTRLRVGYTDFKFDGSYVDGTKTGKNNNAGNGLADYRVFWTEIFSKF